MKVRTIDISGMGGGYENACQLMLKAALEFEGGKAIGYSDFDSMGFAKTDQAKAMQEAMLDAVNRDCTGAMMGATLGHFLYINKNGREAWLSEVEKEDPSRVYEWDGTTNSVPKEDGLTLNEAQHITPRHGKMQ